MDDKDREAVEWLEVTAEWASREGGEHVEHARRVLALAKRALRMEVVGYRVTHGKTYPSFHLRWDDAYDAAVEWDGEGDSTITTLYAEARNE
jgi:hypothetical protein